MYTLRNNTIEAHEDDDRGRTGTTAPKLISFPQTNLFDKLFDLICDYVPQNVTSGVQTKTVSARSVHIIVLYPILEMVAPPIIVINGKKNLTISLKWCVRTTLVNSQN